MDTFLPFYLIGNTLTILGQLCIWVFCLLLLIRERSAASIFLVTGSTLFTLSGTLGIFLHVFFAKQSPELLLRYQGISYIVTATFYLIFTIGFILLFLKYFKALQQLNARSSPEKSN